MGERTLLDGPWDAVESTSYNGEFLVIDPHGHVVAMCRHWPKHNEAHARLIAKARHLPELVEALEAVNAVTRIGDDMDFAEAFGAAMHKVRAALALVQDEDHG